VGQAIEVYKTGAGSNPIEVAFAHTAAVNGTTLTLTSPLPGYSAADVAALRLRRVGATFVTSRDNGSVVTPIERIDGSVITVASLGPDEVHGFAAGQWVEVRDDIQELEGLPGQLLRIASVDVGQ